MMSQNGQHAVSSGSMTRMGRGTLYLMAAQAIFVVSNYVIHVGLGRFLGPESYGIFGVVITLMTFIDLFLTSGLPRGVAKYIAEDNARLGSIIRAGNRLQVGVSLILFALLLGLAGFFADWLGDPKLTPYIRISAFAMPFYAMRAIYGTGYLNGLRQFSKQASVRVFSSLSRIAATFILVAVGLSVTGAILGYIFSALIGLILGYKLLGSVERGKVSFGWRKLVGFGMPAMFFAVAFHLLMSIDLYAVKAIGEVGAEVGYYTATTTISRVSYFIFVGMAMTLLPSISRSTSASDDVKTGSYIRQSMRYMLMLIIPGVLLISATSADLLTLVYSSVYVEAANSLRILVFGLALLTVFFVLSNIIMGSGRPMVTLWIALPLIVIDVVMNIFLIPRYGLVGAAWATTIVGFLGMCASATYVLWKFNALMNPKSLGRICLASLVVYIITLQISLSPVWLPLIYVGLLTLYIGLLWLIRELKREDLVTFKRVMPSRTNSDADSISGAL